MHSQPVYCKAAGEFSKDNKSQRLHGIGTIMCDGVFEQARQTDVKHVSTCSSSLLVQS